MMRRPSIIDSHEIRAMREKRIGIQGAYLLKAKVVDSLRHET